MSLFDPAPKPPSKLAHYRLLGANCGLRVSPICLGGMSMGDAWSAFLGATTKDRVFALLDRYRGQGGNFIDLANNYQDEQAEMWVGEWMEERGCRDEMVIATKYTIGFKNYGETRVGGEKGTIGINFAGNGTKSMRASLDASLKKLRTNYVDLLYLHCWYYDTPIPEIMQSLNDAISSSKVNYIGISDTPAWLVSQANQYARDHNLRPFVAYQGQYSPLTRDLERDIIPMAIHEGMALVSWGVLGQGILSELKEEKGGADGSGDGQKGTADSHEAGRPKIPLPPVKTQYLPALKATLAAIIAGRASSAAKPTPTPAQLLIAYTIWKAPHTVPVIGCRSIGSLESSVAALDVVLSDEEVGMIDEACPLDVGWPRSFVGAPDVVGRELRGPGDLWAGRKDGVVVGESGWRGVA